MISVRVRPMPSTRFTASPSPIRRISRPSSIPSSKSSLTRQVMNLDWCDEARAREQSRTHGQVWALRLQWKCSRRQFHDRTVWGGLLFGSCCVGPGSNFSKHYDSEQYKLESGAEQARCADVGSISLSTATESAWRRVSFWNLR